MIVLDTNVISALMSPEFNRPVVSWLDGHRRSAVWTTAVTIMEIRFGLEMLPVGRRRLLLEGAFDEAIHTDLRSNILPFTTEAAECAAEIVAARHRRGRQIDRADTMIAGIVMSAKATLATRNIRHFNDIALPLVDPWSA